MTNHLRLYARPQPLACSLAISGTIDKFRVGEAYEGRLNVSGQHGDVSVLSFTGLPDGGAVAWDGANSQLVITWPVAADVPAHDEVVDATNLYFADGAVGWDMGPGWTIVANTVPVDGPDPNAPGAGNVAQYADNYWDSNVINKARVPIVPGKTYTCSVRVDNGKNGGKDTGIDALLVAFDAQGGVVGNTQGDNVIWARDSGWRTATESWVPPSNAAFITPAATCRRRKHNDPVWIGAITWNGATTVTVPDTTNGHGSEDPIHFSVSIRDARGCHATWSGLILDYAVYETSQLYGLFVDDAEEGAPLVTGGSVDNLRSGTLQQSDEDSPLVAGGSVTNLNMVVTIEYTTLNLQGPDDADSPLVTGGSVQMLSVTYTQTFGTYNAPQDDADSPLVTGGSVQVLNMVVTTGYQTYSAAQDDADSPVVTGGSVTNLSITVP